MLARPDGAESQRQDHKKKHVKGKLLVYAVSNETTYTYANITSGITNYHMFKPSLITVSLTEKVYRINSAFTLLKKN